MVRGRRVNTLHDVLTLWTHRGAKRAYSAPLWLPEFDTSYEVSNLCAPEVNTSYDVLILRTHRGAKAAYFAPLCVLEFDTSYDVSNLWTPDA